MHCRPVDAPPCGHVTQPLADTRHCAAPALRACLLKFCRPQPHPMQRGVGALVATRRAKGLDRLPGCQLATGLERGPLPVAGTVHVAVGGATQQTEHSWQRRHLSVWRQDASASRLPCSSSTSPESRPACLLLVALLHCKSVVSHPSVAVLVRLARSTLCPCLLFFVVNKSMVEGSWAAISRAHICVALATSPLHWLDLAPT